MARRSEQPRSINVAVVGVSGTEKDKGQSGVGKSCLCNRFVKSLADDYHVEHISVLSQSDFSSRVINNDHFLYWGETSKVADDGIEYHFHLVEQTEFIDDASFQPFKGGKMEAYVKRCAATKLTSAEKLMYICKNQLGIEKEYEQKVMPDGRFNIDGFICLFDVSMVPSRPIDKQIDMVAAILTNLMKSKKPIVLATTKNDEAFDGFVREAERLIARKEFKGSIALVETSAHENVNVDLAFLVLAQMVDKSKNRMRVVPFGEAARARKDVLDIATEAYQRLVRAQVTDFRALWPSTCKRLAISPDYVHYVELFGQDDAQRLFRRHVKKLKDEHLARKIKGYMDTLPSILHELFPDLPSLGDDDWETVKERIHDHHDFNEYFLECPPEKSGSWAEADLLDSSEMRIPFDVLDTSEAEMVFRNHVNSLQKEQRLQEYRKQFKQLLEETGYVTPGKALSEVQVLFMGRECFEALSESDCLHIYDHHQRDITDKARKSFQELLLEHAHLFYQFKSIAPSGTVTQDDIREITEELQEDSRFKSLDRLDNERRLLLLQHLGFVHRPIPEHCPAFPNCMDVVLERLISTKAHRPSSWNRNSQWLLGAAASDNNRLSLVVLGVGGLAHELVAEIRALCDEDEFEMDSQPFALDYRIIDGDVSLPQHSFRAANFTPQGCFCVFSNAESFEYIRDSLEKTLLSNLEQEDRLPFQGLPIVIVMAAEPSLAQSEFHQLRADGISLAENLQCPFIEVSQYGSGDGLGPSPSGAPPVIADDSVGPTDGKTPDGNDNGSGNGNGNSNSSESGAASTTAAASRFSPPLVSSALRALVSSIQQRAGFLSQVVQTLQSNLAEPPSSASPSSASCQPDIRIIMSMLCADPFSVEAVLGPLLSHQCCFLSGERSLTLETFLGDSKRRVEVVVTSYHTADSFRDDLVHGFILVYSTKRKASLATLVAFSQNIPNLPIQILAVTENGGTANAFFSSELSHQLITAGNAAADRLQAHFMTLTPSTNPKSAVYTPFFKDVWDKKVEIERAFHLEDSAGLNDSGEGTLERPFRFGRSHVPLRMPPRHGVDRDGRHDLYGRGRGSNEGSGSEIYERLPTDGSLGDDGEDAVSPTYPDERHLTPSDDSDLYSTLDRPHSQQRGKENGEHLVKPSQLKSRQKLQHEGQGSRQSYTSAESLAGSYSYSLRGPSHAGGGRSAGPPPGHVFTLQNHPSGSASSAALGLNPTSAGLNPYSTPLPHFAPPPLPPPNHAPSPPPYAAYGGGAGSGAVGGGAAHGDSLDASSPKLGPRDAAYGGVRSTLRYSSFQQSAALASPGQYPSAPPPPPGAATPRFSLFQPLVQAEAALWGEQRPSGLRDPSALRDSSVLRDPSAQNLDKKSRGGFQVFPPPSTPPEPAPPDPRGHCASPSTNTATTATTTSTATATATTTTTTANTTPPPSPTPNLPAASGYEPQVPPRWQLRRAAAASSSLPTASSHTSLDEAACWLDDSVFLRRTELKDDSWGHPTGDTYAHRAFTTGRRKIPPPNAIPPIPPIPPGGLPPHIRKHQQPQQHHHPGKINLSEFANVTDAIARMKLVTGGGKEPPSGNAPPPPPPRLAKMKEGHSQRGHFGSYDGDYSYNVSTQDSAMAPQVSTKSRTNRYRREKGRPVYSDSDSDWSSPEHRPGTGSTGGGSQGSSMDAVGSRTQRKTASHKRPRRKRAAIPVATPRVPPLPSMMHQTPPPSVGVPAGVPLPLSARSAVTEKVLPTPRLRDPIYGALPDDESSIDVSSPRAGDIGSPLIGFMTRQREGGSSADHEREQSTQRRRDKAKAKEDEKLEKRRLKEEERLRREREKEKEREKKREQRGKAKSGSGGGSKEPSPPATLEDIVQAEGRAIPLFLEKSVRFIEEEGLDSEGIYRVPGNRAHVDILFQKFQEDPHHDVRELDIAVNAVATALKDFFSKRLPPVLTPEQMDELEEISMTPDRSCRLLALRGLLRKLSTASFDVLKFIFQHFVKVTENCKANSMDSKNLAICWWPTLLPFEFTDMGRFEVMRPHLEDTVQAMIDQFPFLFLGKDEVVMV